MQKNKQLHLTPWGQEYILERKKVKNINFRVRADGSLYISAPPKAPVSFLNDLLLQRREWIEQALERTRQKTVQTMTAEEEKELRRRAPELFLKKLQEIYARMPAGSVPYPQMKIRKMTSRWGSCMPSKKTVTLNLFLASVPDECLEYVIVHELCHFREANHSARFYACLQEYMPDWKKRRQKLREYESLLRGAKE